MQRNSFKILEAPNQGDDHVLRLVLKVSFSFGLILSVPRFMLKIIKEHASNQAGDSVRTFRH